MCACECVRAGACIRACVRESFYKKEKKKREKRLKQALFFNLFSVCFFDPSDQKSLCSRPDITSLVDWA